MPQSTHPNIFVRINLVRRILKTIAILLGEEEGQYVCMPSSLTLRILAKLGLELTQELLNDLLKQGFLKVKKIGRGARLCIAKDDEYVKIRDFIFECQSTRLSLEEFEQLFDDLLVKLRARSVTGFVDLGLVKDYMMKQYGISEDLFVEYVTKLLTTKKWKYAVCHGGSFRVKIGNVHVGLVKLVRT